MSGLDELLSDFLARRRQADQFRQRCALNVVDAVHVEHQGRTYVNFASNNYLGLTHHPRIIERMLDAGRRLGAGAAAASLVSGYSLVHEQAEQAVARWKSAQAALLFSSGYQANAAAVAAMKCLARAPRFLLDKLCHASLIEAARASGLEFRVFPHNHLLKLRRLLQEADAGQPQIVVTESIFSMDGDAADLRGLAELKKEHSFILLLDEAHGGGVYGAGGAGLACELGLRELADVTVVTFSKAMGLMGGAVCGSRTLCDALLNGAPPAIYSTSISPMLAAAIPTAIEVMAAEPRRQQRVRELALRVRSALAQKGLSIPAGDSPIVPVIVGSESTALRTAERLRDAGMWAIAIRPPTVPPAASRVRLTLSCEHTDAEVERLIQVIADG